jgi:hypothetical protein
MGPIWDLKSKKSGITAGMKFAVRKPNSLMLFREIIAVYCENHVGHINTLCGQNAEIFNVKAGGT